MSGRLTCLEGDYNDLPVGIPPADLAYAIESFVHGPDPQRFFAQCRKLIRAGGVLIVCDDFVRATTDPRAAAAIDRFKRGWHINSLLDASRLQTLARDAGFKHESTTDLSRYLELDRPRDQVISLFAAAAGWLPGIWSKFGPLLGGSALQDCLKHGWIGYDLVAFTRKA
jgi:hypothetical protein